MSKNPDTITLKELLDKMNAGEIYRLAEPSRIDTRNKIFSEGDQMRSQRIKKDD